MIGKKKRKVLHKTIQYYLDELQWQIQKSSKNKNYNYSLR